MLDLFFSGSDAVIQMLSILWEPEFASVSLLSVFLILSHLLLTSRLSLLLDLIKIYALDYQIRIQHPGSFPD